MKLDYGFVVPLQNALRNYMDRWHDKVLDEKAAFYDAHDTLENFSSHLEEEFERTRTYIDTFLAMISGVDCKADLVCLAFHQNGGILREPNQLMCNQRNELAVTRNSFCCARSVLYDEYADGLSVELRDGAWSSGIPSYDVVGGVSVPHLIGKKPEIRPLRCVEDFKAVGVLTCVISAQGEIDCCKVNSFDTYADSVARIQWVERC